MDNMTSHLNEVSAGQVPDLDWLSLKIEDKDNIPTDNNVRAIPQLEAQWAKNKPKGTTLMPNTIIVQRDVSAEHSKEEIDGVVKAAKRAAMQGVVGKELAKELGRMYPTALVAAAKEELVKVAGEQGLLGNVYVDISAYGSCKEAASKLGPNKVRSAQYVIGECKHVCASHNEGYCGELKKKVVLKVVYDQDLFDTYEKHLKVVGKIAADEKIPTKGALQEALLKSNAPKANNKAGDAAFTDSNTSFNDYKKSKEAFERELSLKAASVKEEQAQDRFTQAKPILAFIQDHMLRGKVGNSLKEVIASKYDEAIIARFAAEINKMISLQGLLGNVYADVSYYRDASDAISAIKKASTSPQYLVQTITAGEFDDTLERVAKATGCAILPKDGKIDSKIAYSYIDDMMFTDRIALDKGADFKKSIEAGVNALGIIREAFLATLDHKKTVKMGGTKASFTQSMKKASVDVGHLKTASYKALESGVSLNTLERKIASYVPAAEAAGMIEEVLASVKEVNAGSLDNCTTQKYSFNQSTKLVPTVKCASCIFNNKTSCLKVKLAYKGMEEILSSGISLSASNVIDLKQEFEMSGNSGMDIDLNRSASEISFDVDSSYNNEGIDQSMKI